MTKLFKNLALTLALIGCGDASTHVGKRVAKNLQMLVHSKHDDLAGYREARKVCVCAAKKAQAEWPSEKFETYNALLDVYASELRVFYSEVTVKNPRRVVVGEPSSLPTASDELQSLNLEMASFITECEESIGARVEF